MISRGTRNRQASVLTPHQTSRALALRVYIICDGFEASVEVESRNMTLHPVRRRRGLRAGELSAPDIRLSTIPRQGKSAVGSAVHPAARKVARATRTSAPTARRRDAPPDAAAALSRSAQKLKSTWKISSSSRDSAAILMRYVASSKNGERTTRQPVEQKTRAHCEGTILKRPVSYVVLRIDALATATEIVQSALGMGMGPPLDAFNGRNRWIYAMGMGRNKKELRHFTSEILIRRIRKYCALASGSAKYPHPSDEQMKLKRLAHQKSQRNCPLRSALCSALVARVCNRRRRAAGDEDA